MEDTKESARRGAQLFLDLPPEINFDIGEQSSTARDLSAWLILMLLEDGATINVDHAKIILSLISAAYVYGYLDKSAEITDPTPPQP